MFEFLLLCLVKKKEKIQLIITEKEKIDLRLVKAYKSWVVNSL